MKTGAQMVFDTAGAKCSLSYDGKEVDTDCALGKTFAPTLVKCHEACTTCSGPGADQCLTCSSWNLCYRQGPRWHDVQDAAKGTGYCRKPHPSCQTSTGPLASDCTLAQKEAPGFQCTHTWTLNWCTCHGNMHRGTSSGCCTCTPQGQWCSHKQSGSCWSGQTACADPDTF
jgi:hypothetical protein